MLYEVITTSEKHTVARPGIAPTLKADCPCFGKPYRITSYNVCYTKLLRDHSAGNNRNQYDEHEYKKPPSTRPFI